MIEVEWQSWAAFGLLRATAWDREVSQRNAGDREMTAGAAALRYCSLSFCLCMLLCGCTRRQEIISAAYVMLSNGFEVVTHYGDSGAVSSLVLYRTDGSNKTVVALGKVVGNAVVSIDVVLPPEEGEERKRSVPIAAHTNDGLSNTVVTLTSNGDVLVNGSTVLLSELRVNPRTLRDRMPIDAPMRTKLVVELPIGHKVFVDGLTAVVGVSDAGFEIIGLVRGR